MVVQRGAEDFGGWQGDGDLAQVVDLDVLRAQLSKIDACDDASVRHEQQPVPKQETKRALAALGGDDLLQTVFNGFQPGERPHLPNDGYRIG